VTLVYYIMILILYENGRKRASNNILQIP